MLLEQARKQEASSQELFAVVLRHIISEKDSRADDMNALYAFSRNMLTTVLD